jgi:hypothetical protein
LDGGDGDDDLKGGKGADRFVCDKGDKIIDYNSLENDRIMGQCKYEDKGLIIPKTIPDKEISKPIPDKEIFKPRPIPSNPSSEKNSLFPTSTKSSNDGDIFENSISKFINMQIAKIF